MTFSRTGALMSAICFAFIPLFPSFITLTGVSFPGVSVVPRPVAIGLMVVVATFSLIIVPTLFAKSRAPVTLLRPLLAFLAAALTAFALGLNWRDGSVFMIVLLMIVIWHSHIDRFGDGRGYLRGVWWAYLSSGALACIAAIVMVVLRRPADLYLIANGRAVGTFVLPGELAGYCIFLIPIGYAIARTAQERALQIVAWIACISGLIAMTLTFSRTGWIALAVAVAIIVAARSRRMGLIQAGVVVAAALAIVAMLFNEHHNPSENYTRLSIWQAAVGIIDRFPLTGVGPFGFSKIYPLVRLPAGDATAFHAHSLFLTFFAELGVVGLAAFLWFLYAYGRAIVAAIRRAKPAPAFVAIAIAAGVGGCLVQGLIDTVSVVIFGLLFPMLALSLAVARAPEPVH